MTTATCGSSRRTRCVTLMPDVRGRSASMTSTSGSSSSVFVAASSPSLAVPTSSMSASFWRTWLIPRLVRRLESARTTRMLRSVLSAKRPSSFAAGGGLRALDREEQCNRGALPGRRLDLQSSADELRALAHREQSDRLRAPRGLHQVESDAVVGHVQDPARRGALPDDADGRRARVLVHVLQRLLHYAVHREVLRRLETGLRRVERARHLDAAARFPFDRVVADRLCQRQLGELRRTQVVDHRAHRVERRAELTLEARELAAEGLLHFGRCALGEALKILDLEDRVRKDLRGAVVNVAIQALALRLEALQDTPGDLETFVLGLRARLGLDARAKEIRRA